MQEDNSQWQQFDSQSSVYRIKVIFSFKCIGKRFEDKKKTHCCSILYYTYLPSHFKIMSYTVSYILHIFLSKSAPTLFNSTNVGRSFFLIHTLIIIFSFFFLNTLLPWKSLQLAFQKYIFFEHILIQTSRRSFSFKHF